MSPEGDRIAVPTNGKHPHPVPGPEASAPVTPPAPPATVAGPFTPTQLAVGFGILAAALTLLVGGLRRRSRASRPGRFGRR
ncbi:MAG TPA: hypothetical protein VIU37_07910 [Candidatus Limnocylindrales bacterium]|jgi:hypothetical protein